MINPGTTHGRLPDGKPPWIFPWQPPKARLFGWIYPIAMAGSGLIFLLAFVRIKVTAPQFEMGRKASLIQVAGTGDGLLWARRARESGPLLSRFELSSWPGFSGLEQEALDAARLPTPTYQPALRRLPPPQPAKPLALAIRGEPVLPQRVMPPIEPSQMAPVRSVPVLYPLCELGTAELPPSLPPFDGILDPADATTDWRFLLRLQTEGRVEEVVPMAKATEAGSVALENWLRQINFDPKLWANGGWIGVRVKFNNFPIDGTDPR